MKPSILFLGDSFTAGYGLFPEQSMTALIQKELEAAAKDIQVIPAGVSGDTTADALERLPRYLKRESSIAYAVLELGTNDFIQGFSVQAMRENFKRIVSALRQFNPTIQIFLMQMRMFPGFGVDEEYEAMYAQLAIELGLTLLPFPFTEVAGEPELNLTDGIHPNAKGMAIVAADVWASLRQYL
ncbi:MAG: arylesterase [Leptospirales bacterium]|nr:arylesterase [Leptospirales bacterium]